MSTFFLQAFLPLRLDCESCAGAPVFNGIFVSDFRSRYVRISMSTPSTSKSASPTAEDNVRQDEQREDSEKIEKNESDKEVEREGEDSMEEGEDGSVPKVTGGEGQEEEGGSDVPAVVAPGVISQGDWQAIWSQQHNLYYFHNARTGETTWTNPLIDSQSQDNAYASTSQQHDLQAAALAAGIDPELAFLDPSLVLPAGAPQAGTFQAKFNARTGAFTAPEARDPTHLGEWERAQRMSSVYFDTAAYDEEVQRRKMEEEEGARKRKRITKKDLVRCCR
jgi:hypothetical protein